MKKKEAIKSGIEQMDAEQRRLQEERERERLNKQKDNARPSLIKRIGAGLLDFVFAALLAGGLFTITYFSIFPSLGYQDSAAIILTSYEESGLFVVNNAQYEEMTSHYDDEERQTPESYYDVAISNYYLTNDRAVKANKNDEYVQRKLDSGYYELNEEGVCVRKNDVTPATAKTYLEKEYGLAVDFFYDDPDFNKAYRTTYDIMSYSLLIIISISAGFFYFAVPLLDNRYRTFGYMICRIIPVDSKTMGETRRSMIALRSFIFVIITYISPLTFYFWLGGFTYAFIPFFLNTVILSFSRTNSGLHDYASQINVINKSHTNAFATLQQITGQGDNN